MGCKPFFYAFNIRITIFFIIVYFLKGDNNMEEKIINGHKQFVFSDNEKEEIRYLFVEQGYS